MQSLDSQPIYLQIVSLGISALPLNLLNTHTEKQRKAKRGIANLSLHMYPSPFIRPCTSAPWQLCVHVSVQTKWWIFCWLATNMIYWQLRLEDRSHTAGCLWHSQRSWQQFSHAASAVQSQASVAREGSSNAEVPLTCSSFQRAPEWESVRDCHHFRICCCCASVGT